MVYVLQLEEKPIHGCKKTFEELLAERLAVEGDTHGTESPSTPVRKSPNSTNLEHNFH